ncbi:MAG: tyrosine--tRNA ligase [Nanoarchaeota archaeon]
MDLNEKLELIKRNTQEIITEEELTKLLKTKSKPVMYIGTAITNQPHIAYFLWCMKCADFLKAGFKVKVLLADLHGALDNTPWPVLEKRYVYYKAVIELIFKAIGVNTKNLEFVKGSEFQIQKNYFLDVLKFSTFVTVEDCRKAASEVVKLGEHPKLAGLIYPIMQSLDEEYLGVDLQYGGIDQRKILVFARENLPKLRYKPRVELMTPIIPGLTGKKMSASDPKSKIDLLDDEEEVKRKVLEAFCEAGKVEDNGVLAFLKYVIFTIKKDNKEVFALERDKKYGGDTKYKNYEDLENDYVTNKIHPLDLKKSLAREINLLLKPFRDKRENLKKLAKDAYSS